jgi:hypothetical protein
LKSGVSFGGKTKSPGETAGRIPCGETAVRHVRGRCFTNDELRGINPDKVAAFHVPKELECARINKVNG